MNKKTQDVINGFTHSFYQYTIELATFYRQITTGEAYGELIVNYKPRETDEQKEQRVEITQNRTKSISGKIEGFFKRTFRPDKIKFELTHDDEDSEKRIISYTENYGLDGQSLLHWSEETALFYNNVDPNAFYWVKHSIKDGVDMFEPFIFTSECVKDYEIKNGIVKWAVCELSDTVRYMKDGQGCEKTISVLYNFSKEGLETSIEVNKELLEFSDYYEQFVDEQGMFIGNKVDVNGKTYLVIFEESDIDFVPLSRIGYNHDKKTDKKTYVSFWDSASEDYKILVTDGSVFDVSKALHGFPQKFQYYTPCGYQNDLQHYCDGGIMRPSNETCPSCGGSGHKIHISSQDIILIPLPTEENPVVIKPSDLAAYAAQPFDFMEMQKALVDGAEPKITRSIFGVDISDREAGDRATATAVNTYNDTAQDVLFDFTKSPRKIYMFTIQTMAAYLGIENVGYELLYTNRYDLESEGQLIDLLKRAKDAGAGASAIENIMDRLAVKQNRTDNSVMNVYKELRKFMPFAQVEKEILTPYLLSLPDSSTQKALYFNFKQIATQIANTVDGFLLMDYEAQEKEVNKIAKEYAATAVQENSIRGIADISREDVDIIDEE